MASTHPAPRVLWPQVWGLASVQGAITLCWVIYNLYLVRLLTQYGFSEGLATSLIVIETGAAVLLEPLMGSLSDRLQRWMGSRFPMVAAGVILSAACFLAIPLSLIFGGPGPVTRWLLPVAAVAWAFAMTIFRSPVLSLLGRYAMATQQPQAASILTLVGGVTGALAPLAGDLILRLGPLVAFALGSLVMLGAAWVLRLTQPDQMAAGTESSGGALSVVPLVAIFIIGISATLGLRLLLTSFAATLTPLTTSPNLVMGLIFLAIAALAFPMGRLARRSGAFGGMAIGLGGLAVLSSAAIFTGTLGLAVLLAIAIGGSISLISNCTIPVALAAVPPTRAGLGTGLYFGGVALASSLLTGVIAPAGFGAGLSLSLAAIAFLAAIPVMQPIRSLSRRAAVKSADTSVAQSATEYPHEPPQQGGIGNNH